MNPEIPYKRLCWSSTAFCGLTAVGLLAAQGCAGTSPTLGSPQPQVSAPTLPSRGGSGGPNDPLRSAAGGKKMEANLAPLEPVATPKDLFIIAPYLQLGDSAALPGSGGDSLALLWQTDAEAKADPAQWTVETRPAGVTDWAKASAAPQSRKAAPPGVPAVHVWRSPLTGLASGALFDYRISKDGKPVFAARARARRASGEDYHFVVMGDCAEGNADQKKIAYQASLVKPDFLFITGDIVYDRGRESEYRDHFFPVYNADTADEKSGAPLLRSTLFLAAVGNHDVAYKDLSKYPDGLAFFYNWYLPANGPVLTADDTNAVQATGDNAAAEKALKDASGDAYPRMANYSFDYGNSHWTVLDSNPNVNWSTKALQEWLEKDLSGAKNATWRFVAFHHPPFHSSEEHKNDQFMRVLCPLFEKYKVDIVWSGHVHNYQRSYPLKFGPKTGTDTLKRDEKGAVEGQWTLDKNYDGKKNTHPSGVLYIVTGAGGAGLYSKATQSKPDTWQPFTAQYIAQEHSLTVVEVSGKRLSVKQVSDAGKEVDSFAVTK